VTALKLGEIRVDAVFQQDDYYCSVSVPE